MKNDARFLLNRKKWKTHATESQRGGKRSIGPLRGPVDARKILNLKRAKKNLPIRETIRESRNFNLSALKGNFSSKNDRVPGKHVKLARDGNIVITAQSKNTNMASKTRVVPSAFGMSPSSSKQISIPQWEPADIDMDNLEHISIADVLDMDSLPSAALVAPNIQPHTRVTALPKRTLVEEVLAMQNTMVADQVASAAAIQPVQVIVTNLCSSVSNNDIIELFSDVGQVKYSEMTQPGKAIVEFHDAADASRACHMYHNRLLDGQAMKCFLQTNAAPQRTSVSQRLGERIQGPSSAQSALVPGTSSHQSNPRLRYNPRDVRFTVKLA